MNRRVPAPMLGGTGGGVGLLVIPWRITQMPLTPFHFGLGAAIHSVAPKRMSFLAFCAANCVIDCEPFYYIITDNPPLHRFFHTAIGAAIVAAITVLLYSACCWFANRFWLPDLFEWKKLKCSSVVVGAILGAYTHIFLDSIMHHDMRPFAPFSDENPLLFAISIDTLHLACVAAGVLGGFALVVRYFLSRGSEDANKS